jgi:electron transport complex protein RnfB
VAVIDEAWCIGCTLCIKACPADCIVGAPKACTWSSPRSAPAASCACRPARWTASPCRGHHRHRLGRLEPAPGRRGARRYAFRQFRRQREAEENDARLMAKAEAKLADVARPPSHRPGHAGRKRAVIEAAWRARAKRG